MNRRTIIEVVIGFVLLSVGWMIGHSWEVKKFCLDLNVNLIDVISLLATIALGIYIAWILEKEVQDKRIEKDMYLAKINAIDEIREKIEDIFQTSNGKDVDYKKVVSLEHRIKTKRDSIFKHILEKSHGKIKKELTEHDTQLKSDFKDLRNFLTQTNANATEPQDIKIEKDKATYSESRTSSILSSLNNIDNRLLEIKVLVNKM